MDTFFNLLKKTIVGTVFFMFAIVAVYVPQDWNKIDQAHAWFASEATQMLNHVLLESINAETTVNTAANVTTAAGTESLFVKETVLDAIAWALAKMVISSMVQSLISWINSGFEGSPMFVQDLSGFLRNAADEAIGVYLDDLGGVGSFICSPFRLDVQIAVAIEYERTRIGQPAPTCTLTGVFDNFEGFIGGERGSFSQGGWNDWIDISSSPEMYTPFGQVLAGQAGARSAILNAKGEELSILDFGDGFLSGKVCEDTPDSDRENCWISKPGKVIEESLSSHLDSGREALVTADEIDEILSALLSQLAQTALTGAAGLLGLSSGNPHSYPDFDSGSYINQMVDDAESEYEIISQPQPTNQSEVQTIDDTNAVSLMRDVREDQLAMKTLAEYWNDQFRTIQNEYVIDMSNTYDPYSSNSYTFDPYSTNGTDSAYYEMASRISAMQVYIDDTQSYITESQNNINSLDSWISEYPTASPTNKSFILNSYNNRTFYTEADRQQKNTDWSQVF